VWQDWADCRLRATGAMTFMVGLCVVCLDCLPTYETARLRMIGGASILVLSATSKIGMPMFSPILLITCCLILTWQGSKIDQIIRAGGYPNGATVSCFPDWPANNAITTKNPFDIWTILQGSPYNQELFPCLDLFWQRAKKKISACFGSYKCQPAS